MSMEWFQANILGFEITEDMSIKLLCEMPVTKKQFKVQAPCIIIDIMWMLKNETAFKGQKISIGCEKFKPDDTPIKPVCKYWFI